MTANRSPQPSKAAWEAWRRNIHCWYLTENMTCDDIQKRLAEKGFKVSERQIKNRLNEWKLERKKTPCESYMAMFVVSEYYKAAGVEIEFVVPKRETQVTYSSQKVKKEFERVRKRLASRSQILALPSYDKAQFLLIKTNIIPKQRHLVLQPNPSQLRHTSSWSLLENGFALKRESDAYPSSSESVKMAPSSSAQSNCSPIRQENYTSSFDMTTASTSNGYYNVPVPSTPIKLEYGSNTCAQPHITTLFPGISDSDMKPLPHDGNRSPASSPCGLVSSGISHVNQAQRFSPDQSQHRLQLHTCMMDLCLDLRTKDSGNELARNYAHSMDETWLMQPMLETGAAYWGYGAERSFGKPMCARSFPNSGSSIISAEDLSLASSAKSPYQPGSSHFRAVPRAREYGVASHWAQAYNDKCQLDSTDKELQDAKSESMETLRSALNQPGALILPCLSWMILVLGQTERKNRLADLLEASCAVVDQHARERDSSMFAVPFHYAWAWASDNEGEMREAGAHLEKAYEQMRDVWKEHHANTFVCGFMYAFDLLRVGKYQKAVDLLKRDLPAFDDDTGQPDLLHISWLAVASRAVEGVGPPHEAISYLERALKAAHRLEANAYGDAVPALQKLRLSLLARHAALAFKKCDYENAERQLWRVVHLRGYLYGMGTVDVWNAAETLGNVLRERGKEALLRDLVGFMMNRHHWEQDRDWYRKQGRIEAPPPVVPRCWWPFQRGGRLKSLSQPETLFAKPYNNDFLKGVQFQ